MIDVIVLACAAIAAITAAAFLRPQAALVLSVLLGVLQVYLTTHVSVSLGVVWQLATWITVIRGRRELPRARGVSAAFRLLLIVSLTVLVWSPDRSAGLTLTAQILGLGATAALAVIVVRRRGLSAPALVLGVVAAASAVSIVLFRVSPGIEHVYFQSPLFGLLNGHDLAAHFFTTERNNALDPQKSGGLFFVNANAASLFSGASAAVLAAAAVLYAGRRRWVFAAASVMQLVAAYSTGSKTAVYLTAAALVTVAVAVIGLVRSRRGLAVAAALALAGIGVVAVPLAVSAAAAHVPAATVAPVPTTSGGTPSAPAATAAAVPPSSTLASDSADAAGTRERIWGIAAMIFEQRPLGTFGYGGWHVLYAPYAQQVGLDPGFPPHDWVIQTWADLGPIGVLAVLVLIISIGQQVVRVLRRTSDARPRLVAVLSAVAVGWILVHGLADNTGFAGGPRLIPIAAVAVGLLFGGFPVAPRPAVAQRRKGADAATSALVRS